MNHRSDYLNTRSYSVPECMRNNEPAAGKTPAEAGADIFSYFKEVEHWPNHKIKKLAERVLNLCDGGILESTREVVVNYFANLLHTDPTTFLTSGRVNQSFSETMGSESEYGNLSHKLNRGQALCIAKSIMGKTQALNLEYDSCSRGGSVEDFSFNVIYKICQMKGIHYSIQNFLDDLKNPDVST